MSQRKKFIGLIIGYFIAQLLSMVSGVFTLIYIVLFFLSLFMGIVWINKVYLKSRKLNTLKEILAICFIANFILTVIYLKVLYFNPQINWTLENGGIEQDPWILLTYFPSVFFVVSLIVFIIGSLFIKLKHSKISS